MLLWNKYLLSKLDLFVCNHCCSLLEERPVFTEQHTRCWNILWHNTAICHTSRETGIWVFRQVAHRRPQLKPFILQKHEMNLLQIQFVMFNAQLQRNCLLVSELNEYCKMHKILQSIMLCNTKRVMIIFF